MTVPLGEHGGSITLTEQAGTYRRNGAVIASGATVEGSNSQTYRLTLETGRWTAEYVPPDPSAVALGTSGEAVLVARKEDGTYLAGETPIESGGTFTGSNGSQYRLTLSQGNWQAMYLAPDPVQVMLGVSGGTVTVRRNEDGSYTTGTAAFESGGDPITGSNGSQYRLTLRANQWQVEYVPLPDATVTLGASGGTVTVRRNEDGSYRTANAPLQSGDLISAPNGSRYRLTLIGNDGNAWRAAYVAPEPGRVELGGSGRFVTVTRNEDGFYTTGTERFHSGDLVPDGRGNFYRFVLVGSEWSADYVPQNVDVRLGNSQITVRLTREEGGEHWLGRTRVTSGYIHPATNGSRYRFTLEDGRWTAVFVPDSIQVPAGDSGKSLVLLRLEDGTYVLNQRTVESGQTVTLEGNEYRLTQTGNAWTARFIAGTVTVDLPTGRTIELTKREDGTYVRDDGRVVRSGSTHTFYGVRYRLTLGANGWRAVRRVTIPSSGGGSPSTPSPQPSTTDEIETKLPTAATDFDLRDAGSDTANTRGTHLYVGPDMNRQSYAVEELLGRGIVRKRPAYVEVAKQEIEAIAARVGRFRGLYEIDKDSLTNSEFGLAALWEQAETAFQKIPGLESRTLSRPWGRSSNIGTGHISDVIEDLGTVADNLASVEAFVDAYGSANRSNFTLPRSKLAFGSTGDTRFGAYANRKSSDGTWDTGYFAYSRAEAPSNLRAQGKATYSGDTVAVLPSGDTDTPETYSGRITLTATFSTGIVAGEITDLEDDDGGSLVHDSRSVASVQLPNATLSSSSTGMFESASGQATLAPGPSLNRVNATFEGQLVDGDSEAFGRWSLTLTSSTLQGAFGTTKSTSGSTSTAVVDTRGTKVARSAFSKATSITTFTAQGSALDLGASVNIDTGGGASVQTLTTRLSNLNLRSAQTFTQSIRASSQNVGTIRIGNTSATRFGTWEIPARTSAPTVASAAYEAFAYSPLTASPTSVISDLNFSASYKGGARAVAKESGGDLTAFAGSAQVDINWKRGATADALTLRLHSFSRTSGTSNALIGADLFFKQSSGSILSSFSLTALDGTDSVHANITSPTGTAKGTLVGADIDGPRAVIGTWTISESSGVMIEGSYGADLVVP